MGTYFSELSPPGRIPSATRERRKGARGSGVEAVVENKRGKIEGTLLRLTVKESAISRGERGGCRRMSICAKAAAKIVIIPNEKKSHLKIRTISKTRRKNGGESKQKSEDSEKVSNEPNPRF